MTQENASVPTSLADQAEYVLSILDGKKPPLPVAPSKRPYTVSVTEEVNRLGLDDEDVESDAQPEQEATLSDTDEILEDERAEPEDPALRPPPSWTGDAKALFAQLPPGVRTEIVRRESERDRGLHQRLSEIAAERQRTAAELTSLIETARLTDPVLAEGMRTDWQRLAETDPAAYQLRHTAFQRRLSDVRAASQARDALATRLNEDTLKHEQERLAEKLPEWKDPQARARIVAQLETRLSDWGFEASDLRHLRDHRLVLMALDAVRFREQQADPKRLAAKRVNGLPRLQRPGGAEQGDEPATRLASLRRRAIRSGNLHQQADYILRALDQE